MSGDGISVGGRDLQGELEIAARIMITSGDEREDARLTRTDRLLIRNAIFTAARVVKAGDRSMWFYPNGSYGVESGPAQAYRETTPPEKISTVLSLSPFIN